MKFCINCGTQLEDEENFCSNCGTRNLSDEVQSTLSDASAEASESLMEAETAPEEVAPDHPGTSPTPPSSNAAIPVSAESQVLQSRCVPIIPAGCPTPKAEPSVCCLFSP